MIRLLSPLLSVSSLVVVVVVVAVASSSSATATTTAKSRRRRRISLPSAPPRPSSYPDVDYGAFGTHPFDNHRHLYDDYYYDGGGGGGDGRRNSDGNGHSRRRRDGRRDQEGGGGEDPDVDDVVPNPAGGGGEDSSYSYSSSYSSSYSAKTTTLDPAHDDAYRPLRMQFDVSDLKSNMDVALSEDDQVAATKLYLLMYEILPMTASVWGDVLRVVPVNGGIYPLGIYVGNNGGNDDKLIPNFIPGEGGGGGRGGGGGGYDDDPVRMKYCPDETTAGIAGGADLLVYATVNRHCGNDDVNDENDDDDDSSGIGGTLASALSCQRDQYDRPITGSIDFCLEWMTSSGGTGNVDALDVEDEICKRANEGKGLVVDDMVGTDMRPTETWDGWMGLTSSSSSSSSSSSGGGGGDGAGGNREMIQYSVGVAVHEIGHVLGISSDSLQYFRHPVTGVPLTRRPFEVSTVTCINGEERQYVGMPSPLVLQEGRHAITGNRYFELVTPTVRRVVQNQFNCPTMKGARLENQQGTPDCFGSHWDEMLFYTEIMTPVFSQSVNVLSPLTLAFLEDSGWYRANYESEYVQISVFGHGAGCGFVEGNCVDPYTGEVPYEFSENFCNVPTALTSGGSIDAESSGPQTCDPSHTQKAYCDLVNTNEMVAIGNLATMLEPPPPSFQYFEGRPELRPLSLTLADYCPVPHLNGQSCLEYDGSYSLNGEMESIGETYGPNSRCVETDGSRDYSLCLETVCNTELGMVAIMAGGQYRMCQFDGQVHEIMYGDDGTIIRIKCPKAALICPNLFCPSNCSGRGTCVYATAAYDHLAEVPEASTASLGTCTCDSADDDTAGCYRTPMSLPPEYDFAAVTTNETSKSVVMLIVGSLMAVLAIFYMVVRHYKEKHNFFM